MVKKQTRKARAVSLKTTPAPALQPSPAAAASLVQPSPPAPQPSPAAAASLVPPAPSPTPLSAVRVVKKGSPYEGTGGIVEAVKRGQAGDAVTVDMDVDHKRVEFTPGELIVLQAH